MKQKLLTSILTVFSVVCVYGVDIQSRILSPDAGLPDNNVRSVSVDAKGYLWLGTPNGLYRYDGYTFTAFHYTGEGNMKLLNNNHITGVKHVGNLMVIREQGNMYSAFDTHLNRFIEMGQKEMEAMFAYKFDDRMHSRLVAPYLDIIKHGGNVIKDDKDNPVVIDNKGHLWHIDKQTGKTVKMTVFDEKLFPLVNSHRYKVCLTNDDRLIWVSTNGCGITVYDRVEDTEQHIRQTSGLISTDYILDMCIDQWNNVWAVNEYRGVARLTASWSKTDCRLLMPHSQEMRSNQVYIMHEMADSTMFVANTKGDVWVTDPCFNLPETPTYTGLDVHAVLPDAEGGLWIGTRQQGLRAPDGRWYKHDEGDRNSVSTNNIYCLLRDRKGNLWVAGEDASLDLAERQSDGSYRFRHFIKQQLTIRVMLEDRHGYIWIGTKSGLYRINPEKLKKDVNAYAVELTEKDLKYSDVSCIHEDANGRLWVGTIGAGVFVREKDKFYNLTVADGIISNEVHSLITDRTGILWIATNRGITCYDPVKKSCRYVYNEGNPLTNYFTDNCVSQLPDGRLAFGTNYGIMIYTPTEGEKKGSSLSRLAITDLQINGVSVVAMGDDSPLDVAPDDADQITLSHNQNSLIFHFSMFTVMGELGTRYSYMLEDYDTEWSEPSVYNFATYKNLEPGQYVLRVRAFDIHSSSNQEKQFVITIKSPWWLTWWAYLIYFVLFVLIGYAVYLQLRTVYDLRRRISIEKELTEYKLVFFTNISHEFRTPLTIIRGAMERIRSIRTVPAELRQPISNMGRSTDRMLRLVNQLLEFRKMQAGKLKLALEETDIISFVRDIFQNFNDLAENKKISYNFISNVKSCEIPIDRQHIDKVIFNLLSNAFKYTPTKGSITVAVRHEGQHLAITVTDTGVGIPKEKQASLFQRFMQSNFSNNSIGIGLHLSKALIEVHHGSIYFEENKPQGSVFIVELPTERMVYKPEDFLLQSDLEPVIMKQEPEYKEMMGQPMNDRNVLVVEDDADVVAMLKQVLGHVFHVQVAMDGNAALELLKNNEKPDLIVSDVIMPLMDGFELTRQIRNNPDLQTIPVLLLTALDSEKQRLKGTEYGADAYITKPFSTRLLISTCRQLIEQRDLLRNQAREAADTPAAPLTEIIVEERDKQLLNAMNVWLYAHINNPMLSVDDVAEAMGYRRSIFFKKVKALTGQTPADYIKTLRMNRAAEMLRVETITVAEVCYKVGISDPHYFAKIFKQKFGVSPKKYQQGKSE